MFNRSPRTASFIPKQPTIVPPGPGAADIAREFDAERPATQRKHSSFGQEQRGSRYGTLLFPYARTPGPAAHVDERHTMKTKAAQHSHVMGMEAAYDSDSDEEAGAGVATSAAAKKRIMKRLKRARAIPKGVGSTFSSSYRQLFDIKASDGIVGPGTFTPNFNSVEPTASNTRFGSGKRVGMLEGMKAAGFIAESPGPAAHAGEVVRAMALPPRPQAALKGLPQTKAASSTAPRPEDPLYISKRPPRLTKPKPDVAACFSTPGPGAYESPSMFASSDTSPDKEQGKPRGSTASAVESMESVGSVGQAGAAAEPLQLPEDQWEQLVSLHRQQAVTITRLAHGNAKRARRLSRPSSSPAKRPGSVKTPKARPTVSPMHSTASAASGSQLLSPASAFGGGAGFMESVSEEQPAQPQYRKPLHVENDERSTFGTSRRLGMMESLVATRQVPDPREVPSCAQYDTSHLYPAYPRSYSKTANESIQAAQRGAAPRSAEQELAATRRLFTAAGKRRRRRLAQAIRRGSHGSVMSSSSSLPALHRGSPRSVRSTGSAPTSPMALFRMKPPSAASMLKGTEAIGGRGKKAPRSAPAGKRRGARRRSSAASAASSPARAGAAVRPTAAHGARSAPAARRGGAAQQAAPVVDSSVEEVAQQPSTVSTVATAETDEYEDDFEA